MLKEESYQARGTLEAADQYRQAKAFDYVPLRSLWVEPDPLLGAIRSSYNRCKSLDHRQEIRLIASECWTALCH